MTHTHNDTHTMTHTQCTHTMYTGDITMIRTGTMRTLHYNDTHNDTHFDIHMTTMSFLHNDTALLI